MDEYLLNWSDVAHLIIGKIRSSLWCVEDEGVYSDFEGWATETSLEYMSEGRSEGHSSIGWYGSSLIHEVPVYATDLTPN